ncbi:DUF418 domain-containing protein [Fibrisoma montanum]|uniref:DUF418 domain-containing protein n=1 Tax=Fibrisoma montanum TaxID=2305895 RepID=A0A418M1L2_9BACT|nr:DUF418 domain-containing protein [Fibrisoma montanum]RIV19492.1 DUF418 domain-containing protein [Fibrisoma montanum]
MPAALRIGFGRLPTLDCVRGLALLGMLVMNSPLNSVVAFLHPEQVYPIQVDQAGSYAMIQFFLHLFVDGPFVNLFSFGFGIGVYLMGEHVKREGLDTDRILKRGLWVLFGFGLVHGVVGGLGDLLHVYALLGFSLLYFRSQSVALLLRWIVGLILFVLLVQTLQAIVFPVGPPVLAIRQAKPEDMVRQLVQTWQHTSIRAIMGLQPWGLVMRHRLALEPCLNSYAQQEIMLLLGLVVGKWRLLHRLAELRVQLSLLLLLAFPVSLILKGLACLPIVGVHLLDQRAFDALLFALADFLGTLLLTGIYLLELGLNLPPVPTRFWAWIGNVGQMWLTNYLLQTLLCMLFFYAYGGGLPERLTLLESLLSVVGIYGFQVWFSTWWLSGHPKGPMEALWRNLVYNMGSVDGDSSVSDEHRQNTK